MPDTIANHMPEQPSAPTGPNYGETLNQLQQLQYMLQSENSPVLGELQHYLQPYRQRMLASGGEPTPEQMDEYKRVGGQFVQDWVAKNMFGGKLPTREDFNGPLRDFEYGKRAEALMADPSYAQSAGGKTRDQLIAELRQTTPQPLEKQLAAMEALWSLVPSEGPKPQQKQAVMEMAPIEMKATPKRATFSSGKRQTKPKTKQSSLPADATDDQRLGEAGLMLLQQLGNGRAPLDFYGQ